MTELLLDPQRAYEALAEALRLFYAHLPTDQTLTAVRDAVTLATEVWQRCELQRATSTKEFRVHVLRLKLLLAGVYQTLDILPGVPCLAPHRSIQRSALLFDMRNTEEFAGGFSLENRDFSRLCHKAMEWGGAVSPCPVVTRGETQRSLKISVQRKRL